MRPARLAAWHPLLLGATAAHALPPLCSSPPPPCRPGAAGAAGQRQRRRRAAVPVSGSGGAASGCLQERHAAARLCLPPPPALLPRAGGGGVTRPAGARQARARLEGAGGRLAQALGQSESSQRSAGAARSLTPPLSAPRPLRSPPLSLTLCAARSQQRNLWRLVACSPYEAFTFDLARTSRRAACAAPAVQAVMQYSLLVPSAGTAGSRRAAARLPPARGPVPVA